MKKTLIAALLAIGAVAPALAADVSQLSVGGGVGFNYGGILSLHADYNIAQLANNQPIKLRAGFEHYSNDEFSYKWSYNVYSLGAYYDFGKLLKMGNKIHPFAGAGFGFGNVSCSSCNGYTVSPTVGGSYVIGGIQYEFSNNLAAEASLKLWGGLASPTIGLNYKF